MHIESKLEHYLLYNGYVKLKYNTSKSEFELAQDIDYLSSMTNCSFFYAKEESTVFDLCLNNRPFPAFNYNKIGLFNVGLRGHGGIGLISPRPNIQIFKLYMSETNPRVIRSDFATEHEIDRIIEHFGVEIIHEFSNIRNLFIVVYGKYYTAIDIFVQKQIEINKVRVFELYIEDKVYHEL